MHGKDLIGSAQVGQRICKLLGKRAPLNFMYELFLDSEGKKISKSKGDSVLDEWLRYAPQESLNWYLTQNPKKARKLYWETIPPTVDKYLGPGARINYSMLLNLVAITNTDDPSVLWKFVESYAVVTPENVPMVDCMVKGAINYYKDHIEPYKVYRSPTEEERIILRELADAIETKETSEDIMFESYEVGKRHYEKNELRLFFQMIYQVIMGQDSGPRFGQFAEILGATQTAEILRNVAK